MILRLGTPSHDLSGRWYDDTLIQGRDLSEGCYGGTLLQGRDLSGEWYYG